MEKALIQSKEWIIVEQVWFELYRLLRNNKVLEKPLFAAQAADAVDWYSNKSGWLWCLKRME